MRNENAEWEMDKSEKQKYGMPKTAPSTTPAGSEPAAHIAIRLHHSDPNNLLLFNGTERGGEGRREGKGGRRAAIFLLLIYN